MCNLVGVNKKASVLRTAQPVHRAPRNSANAQGHIRAPRPMASGVGELPGGDAEEKKKDPVPRLVTEDFHATPRDDKGYPVTAQKRVVEVTETQVAKGSPIHTLLEKLSTERLFKDMDTGQLFKTKVCKGGMRLVPVFLKPVTWKTSEGFQLANLCLSCLGAPGEFQLWNKETGAQLTKPEWAKRGVLGVSKPAIKHVGGCGETVTTTCLNSLQQGRGIGCKCRKSSAESNLWVNRRPEVVDIADRQDADVLTPPKQWARECKGCHYCPTFYCRKCKETVTTTCLNNLQKGHGIGCKCRRSNAESNLWVNRRPEAVEITDRIEVDVLTPPEQWALECNGSDYCPTFFCRKCKTKVTTTCLSKLQQGQGIGCNCRNKTEGILLKLLVQLFPEVVITPQFPGPRSEHGTMHFDFHLKFPDEFTVLVELDGAQHFWKTTYHFSQEGCERDLLKERFATQKGLCVIRLLQEDVWKDRLNWQGFLRRSVDTARIVAQARVFTPDAPAYTSRNSVYMELRVPKRATPDEAEPGPSSKRSCDLKPTVSDA